MYCSRPILEEPFKPSDSAHSFCVLGGNRRFNYREFAADRGVRRAASAFLPPLMMDEATTSITAFSTGRAKFRIEDADVITTHQNRLRPSSDCPRQATRQLRHDASRRATNGATQIGFADTSGAEGRNAHIIQRRSLRSGRFSAS